MEEEKSLAYHATEILLTRDPFEKVWNPMPKQTQLLRRGRKNEIMNSNSDLFFVFFDFF